MHLLIVDVEGAYMINYAQVKCNHDMLLHKAKAEIGVGMH